MCALTRGRYTGAILPKSLKGFQKTAASLTQGKAERVGTVWPWERKCLRGILPITLNTTQIQAKKMEPTSSQSRTKGVEIEEIPLKHKTHLLCWECGLRLEHIFRGGCIISIPKIIQYQTRHGSDQPALADPVLSRHLGLRRNSGVPSELKCGVIL